MWTRIAAFLVFFMQADFARAEIAVNRAFVQPTADAIIKKRPNAFRQTAGIGYNIIKLPAKSWSTAAPHCAVLADRLLAFRSQGRLRSIAATSRPQTLL